jgi:anti-sigma B factor antagonist
VIETKAQAEVLTLALTGELDVGTQAATWARIDQALATAPRMLVLDLRDVDFLGSAGLSVLIEAQRAARGRGTAICLVADRRATLLPLELTGLTTMFPVVRTPDEALRQSADVQGQQAGVVPRVGADVSQ